MSSPTTRRRYAAAQARDLLKIARRLSEPCGEAVMAENAVKAQTLANRIVWALTLPEERPSGTIDPRIHDGELEAKMQALGEVILDQVQPHGYALLVFQHGDQPGGRMNYVSNSVRADVVVAMREFIAANEERIQPAPETPQ